MESSLIDVNSFLEFERKNHPELKIGDKVRIGIKIIEGNKERVQFYEGTVIAKKNSSINTTITVRKVLQGTRLLDLLCSRFFHAELFKKQRRLGHGVKPQLRKI